LKPSNLPNFILLLRLVVIDSSLNSRTNMEKYIKELMKLLAMVAAMAS